MLKLSTNSNNSSPKSLKGENTIQKKTQKHTLCKLQLNHSKAQTFSKFPQFITKITKRGKQNSKENPKSHTLKIAIESLKGSNFSKSPPFITKITTSTTLNKPKYKT
jgi:transcriptional/translational regulatory protein YebC/TACO1